MPFPSLPPDLKMFYTIDDHTAAVAPGECSRVTLKFLAKHRIC
jgi:hypothetical protein